MSGKVVKYVFFCFLFAGLTVAQQTFTGSGRIKSKSPRPAFLDTLGQGDREAWDFAMAFYKQWVDSMRGRPEKFNPDKVVYYGGFPSMGGKRRGSITAGGGAFTSGGINVPQIDTARATDYTNMKSELIVTEANGIPLRKREGDKQPFMWYTTVQLDDGVATVSYNVNAQGNRVITTPSDTSKVTVLATPRGDTLTAVISVRLLGDSALQINSTDVNDNRWVGVMVIGR